MMVSELDLCAHLCHMANTVERLCTVGLPVPKLLSAVLLQPE